MSDNLVQKIRKMYYNLRKQVIQLENLTTGFIFLRWGVTAVLTIAYILYITLSKSHYAVCYFLYIYILAAFVQFISPKDDGQQMLPITNDDLADAKNFTREMCEFDFWLTCTGWSLFAFVISLFRFTDLPVYWPILVFYCLILTVTIIMKELARWKTMNVDARSAVKHWVGLNKPKYEK